MSIKHLNMALQGGGAHGAFTWGVLDRLLDEQALEIEAISGTSAGAMNALMLAQGWCEGRHIGAQDKLAEFWHRVAEHSPAYWLKDNTSGAFDNGALNDSLSHTINRAMLCWTKQVSPYELNPLDINPLRNMLREMVDFSMLREKQPFKLFIAATEVRSGKIRLFREWELDESRILASACLPSIHRAVEVDGEFYWDGGYSGNPAIYPLVFECESEDILMILLQPLERDNLPLDVESIAERVAEFGFNSTFLREMGTIAYAHQRLKGRRLLLGSMERRVKKLKFHLIESHSHMADLSRLSRYDTRLDSLLNLKALGRQHAEDWLLTNVSRIGRESTFDLAERFG